MKNFLKTGILTVFCLICIQPVYSAEVLKVEALSSFSTAKPVEFISLKAMNSVTLDENVTIPEGVIVKGRITDVKSPKRLKRNATFSVIPVSYTDENGNEVQITEEYTGKFSPKFEIDKGELAKSAALSVGDHFVQGVSMGYHAIEGAVKNEEGNRFKSSAVSVYENSIFSYISKGSELEIREHDLFSLRFKDYDGEDDEEEVQPAAASDEAQPETKNVKQQSAKSDKIKTNERVKKQKTKEVKPAVDKIESQPDNTDDVQPVSEASSDTQNIQTTASEVHWVQEGRKGETLKFGKEE